MFETSKGFFRKKSTLEFVAQNDEYFNLHHFPIRQLIEIHLIQNKKSLFNQRKIVFFDFRKTFSDLFVKDISSESIEKWMLDFQERRQYTEKTMCLIKCQTNYFMKWLEKKKLIVVNPLHKIKFRQNLPPQKERAILSQSEIKTVCHNAKLFDPVVFYPFLYAIIHTGARRSEIMNLKWNYVDFENRFFHFIETKNGESRRVRISDSLFQLVEALDVKGEYVFTNLQGGKLNRGIIQRRIDAFKKEYPLTKNWNYHDLRHSFANNFLKKGGEMYQLQAVLGHKTIKMTVDLYGNLKAQDIENPSPYDF